MPKEFQKFHISQKGMIMRDGKCLIMQLKHEPDHFDYQRWDMPGGRIDEGEDGEAAFKRELEEETGLKDFKDLGVADYFICYPAKGLHPYCGFIRLLEIGDDEIRLSFEHCELKWIGEDEVDDYQYCWQKMPEMIKRGFELYKKIR
jgi:8-oxo-dGTP diphosphatase